MYSSTTMIPSLVSTTLYHSRSIAQAAIAMAQPLHRPCRLILAATTLITTLPLIPLILMTMAPLPAAQALEPINTFRFWGCSPDNYTRNSTFEHNLNKTLTSLLHSKNLLYRSATAGNATSSGSVHSMIQCRGDLTPSECDSCASAIILTDLPKFCSAGMAAIVDADGCYLQYQDISFVPNYNSIFFQLNADNNTDMSFKENRDFALSMAIKAAPQNPNFYNATSYANSTGADLVYAMAQCYGYLSVSQCSQCLSSVIDFAKNRTYGARGAKIFLGSCYARFETYEFTVDALTPAPSPSPIAMGAPAAPSASAPAPMSLHPGPPAAAPSYLSYTTPAPSTTTSTSVNNTSPPSQKSGASANNPPNTIIRVLFGCLFVLPFL